MIKEYAILSDIHGNTWALKAVLDDIRKKGIRRLINLGDIFYGPLDPYGTAELLDNYRMDTVQGNEDRMIYETTEADMANPTLQYVLRQLSEREKRGLRQLPKTKIVGEEIFLCHGTPEDDTEYLLEDAWKNPVALRKQEAIEKLVGNIVCPVIVCGHSHVARAVRLPDGRLIGNPGSVGLPAYSDDSPRFHKMETGTPHAAYALLKKTNNGWDFEDVRIAYDWEKAAERAEKNGRKDWAQWLRTGKA